MKIVNRFFILCTIPAFVIAANKYGPVVQWVTENEATIMWNTTTSTNDVLYWGITETCEQSVNTSGEFHKQKLTGLTPGTRYYYKVNAGTIQSFYTQGTTNSFSFIAYGDSQGKNAKATHIALLKKIKQMCPEVRFTLHSGDLVDGNTQSTWESYWESTYDTIMGNVPIYPTIGNHECYFSGTPALMDCYFYTPQTHENYAFRWENAYCINLFNTREGQTIISPASQKAWLEQKLQEANGDSAIRWIFTWFHASPYSASIHDPCPNAQRDFVPLFDQYHVDIVFNAHNHFYERSKVMKAGQICANQSLEQPVGTIYITAGGGGASLYATSNPSGYYLVQNSVFNFTKVSISEEQCDVTAFDVNGNPIDNFTITKSPQVDPRVKLTPTGLAFTADAGGNNPPAQEINVTNSGVGTLVTCTIDPIQYGSGASSWLTVTVGGSGNTQTLTNEVNIAELATGLYTATVTVVSAGASNSPQTYSVTFTLSPSTAATPLSGRLSILKQDMKDRFRGTYTITGRKVSGGQLPAGGIYFKKDQKLNRIK